MSLKLFLAISLLTLFSSINTKTNAQSPDWLWCKSMGGQGGDNGECIALDPSGSGNIYTTGHYFGPSDFDPDEGIFNLSGSGTFISKLDASGNFIWAKALGGPNYFITINSIVIDPGVNGEVYITGAFNGTADFDPGEDTFNLTSISGADIFISKLDSSGNFQWAKSMGGTEDDQGISIAVNTSGDVYITGYYRGTVDFKPGAGTSTLSSRGENDIFVSKFDSSGNFVWAKSIGGAGDDDVSSIAVDTAGKKEVYTTGYFIGTVDFDPSAGIYNLTSSGSSDIFISKLDSTGKFVWARSMGGTTSDGVGPIAIDPSGSGDVYTAGYFRGTADFDPGADTFNLTSLGIDDTFISKLDSSGNFQWVKAIQSPHIIGITSLAIDFNGDVYNAGVFSGFVDFDLGTGFFYLSSGDGYDVFISKLDASGNFQWAKASSGDGYNFTGAMAIDAFGYVHIVGEFDSPSISFDSITLTNAGSGVLEDVFIAKLGKLTTSVDNSDAELQSITIHPNPATNQLTIMSDEDILLDTDITMYNILGEVVYSITNQNNSNEITIDMSKMVTGIYFIALDIDGNSVVKKVVKE